MLFTNFALDFYESLLVLLLDQSLKNSKSCQENYLQL